MQQYVCVQHPDPTSLLALKTPPFPWIPDTYLTPVIENDPLLQLDFDPDDSPEDRCTVKSHDGGHQERGVLVERGDDDVHTK